ncbi:MAG: beta-propeller fold lactonase family protein [Acidobacteriota bacterium]
MFRRTLLSGVCLSVVFAALPLRADDDRDHEDDRAVYTMTNAAAGNSVMIYRRGFAGSLAPTGVVATGGKGTGAGLGSQGSLVLTQSSRWLLAVNAGSDDLSIFRVTDSGLKLASRTPSGGHMPISVTVSGRVVYVLNAGTPNNISGFTLGNDGSLTPIPNSTRTLSTPSAGPAQVQFSPDGDELVVTEKATNLIDVFPVGSDGVSGTRVSSPSVGMTPFGFAFGKRSRLFVSEAFGGAPSASAISSYNLTGSDTLQVISGSIPSHETAACWLVIDSSGRFGYATNTGSQTVSFFHIAKDGSITLDPRLGATPAGSPIDAEISGDGRFLSVLTSNAATIVTFRIRPDGSLVSVDTVTAPPTGVGLAAQ